jgi:hypothetical protein
MVQKSEMALGAIAQAQGANGILVADNESSTVNGSAFTGVGTVNFAAPATALTTGKRFNVSGAISGLASSVDLTATVTLQRDGVNISNSIPAIVSAGHTTANVFASLAVIDTPPPGSHIYSINLVMGSGTITVGVDQANITFAERN